MQSSVLLQSPSRAGDISSSSSPSMNRRSRALSASLIVLEKATLSESLPTMVEDVTSVVVQANAKSTEDLWLIHGKYYDLTGFMDSHPGGKAILGFSKGTADCTPLYESYHAFANREYITKTLSKYEVKYVPIQQVKDTCSLEYTFNENGFYVTLTKRVREYFGGKTLNESISKNVKANKWWIVKIILQSIAYFTCFYLAFIHKQGNLSTDLFFAFCAGILIIGTGMNAMHDGSHYAIGNRDSWKNKLALRIWNAIAFWDPSKWIYHHTVRHHAFTGDDVLDPDVVHAAPFFRKSLEVDRNGYFNFFPHFLAIRRWFWAIYSAVLYGGFMYAAQVYNYHVRWPLYGNMWNMDEKVLTHNYFEKFWWEYLITILMILPHFYKMNLLVTVAYFLGANLTYALCIVPDHDTFDSAIENHIHQTQDKKVDWGEIQVRHASDFSGVGFFGRIFTEMFGSINVQIAHHLYPSVNHIYLPELVQIIRKTCEEFNIPYAHQESIPLAFLSFVKTIHATMGEDGPKKKSD